MCLMMGNRGACNQIEWDAFSRRARRVLCWGRGEIKKIKKWHARRLRKVARLAVLREAKGDKA